MKKIILALVLIMMIGAGLFFGYSYFQSEQLSYVTISINPEVLLAVNKEGKVVEVTAVNEDADIILSDLNLIGLTAEEASNLIVDAATQAGYINEYTTNNAIEITTVSEDEQERASLEERLMTNLNNHLEEKKVYAVLTAKELGDELKAEAETYNVSNGKMLLIEEAVALDNTLDKQSLADMTIKEIQELIKEKVKERYETLKDDMETLKEEWKNEKEALKEETRLKLQELKASIQNSIENYNSMTDEQKEEAFQDAVEAKKEEIKSIFESLRERVKETFQNSQGTNDQTETNDQAETNDQTEQNEQNDTEEEQGQEQEMRR